MIHMCGFKDELARLQQGQQGQGEVAQSQQQAGQLHPGLGLEAAILQDADRCSVGV